MHPKHSKAFTLIELLIVVAIIAILAAIAVPNFLEAQVRSKVSRAKADIRSVATAIEAYAVDNNKPPREFSTTIYNDFPLFGASGGGVVFPGGEDTDGDFWHGLSTPIAYITTAWLFDPFVNRDPSISTDEQTFTYQSVNDRVATGVFPPTFFGVSNLVQANALHSDFYGAWRMMSVGPDRTYFNNTAGSGRGGINARENILYDPTNGTVSEGNIIRSQKNPEGGQPDIDPNILGAH